jgi:hypothetical protein
MQGEIADEERNGSNPPNTTQIAGRRMSAGGGTLVDDICSEPGLFGKIEVGSIQDDDMGWHAAYPVTMERIWGGARKDLATAARGRIWRRQRGEEGRRRLYGGGTLSRGEKNDSRGSRAAVQGCSPRGRTVSGVAEPLRSISTSCYLPEAANIIFF